MKALLLLSVLLLSAGTSKAAPNGMTPSESYWYGSMIGIGNLLCIQVLEGDIDIDTAKKYLQVWVTEAKQKTPKVGDSNLAIDFGIQNISKVPECKPLFVQ